MASHMVATMKLLRLLAIGVILTPQAVIGDPTGWNPKAPNCNMRDQVVDIGSTLTHVTIHPTTTEDCERSPGATLRGDDNIILHYDQVRETVRQYLNVMARNGARVARLILWYRHIEDFPMQRAAARSDVLGYAVATNGKLADSIIHNLHAFAGDMAQAGYVRLYVNIAPMGTANARTAARKCVAGIPNCFDERFLPMNWSVARQIVTSFQRSRVPGLDVVFDLAAESCFVGSSRSEIESNLSDTVRYMVREYKASFGNGGFVVSCPAAHGPRALAGLRTLESVLHEFDATPAAIDIHLYDTDLRETKQILESAEGVAENLGVTLDVAETYSDNHAILTTVAELVASGRLRRLRTVMMFPRTTKSICQVNVGLPYDIAKFGSLLHRRNDGIIAGPGCQ